MHPTGTAPETIMTEPTPAPARSDAQDELRLWIDIIREARAIGGRDAARRLWLLSPLPSLNAASPVETDWTDAFLAGCTEPSPGARLRSDALWAAYRSWCAERGMEPETRNAFGRAMSKRLRSMKSGVMHYRNVRLRVS